MALLIDEQVDSSLETRWSRIPTEDTVQRTVAALRANNFDARVVDDAAAAKELVLELIPEGSEVHAASSTTLDEIGVTEAIATSGRYDAIRPRIWSMDRKTQMRDILKLSSAPDFMLGSVQALTETGAAVTASFSGSQIGPYSSGAGRVIWVVGAQKIVPDVEAALERVDAFALPMESARAKIAYGINSAVNQVLIMKGQLNPNRVTVIIVREALGV